MIWLSFLLLLLLLLEDRDTRFKELRELLLSREYKPGLIDSAINRAKQIPRTEALKKVERAKASKRPVFVVSYDPRLPSITKIVTRHWRTMHQDPYLADVFPLPPLVAYRRPPNIRDKLIRAKVPEPLPERPRRKIPGMRKCNNCPICPYVTTGQTVKSTQTNYSVDINMGVDCKTKNIIYMLGCKKCKMQYIGETHRTIQDRFSEHLGYVRNNHTNKVTGEHFNSKGHKQSDMSITVVEKLHNGSSLFRKQREKMYKTKFNTKYKGMNGIT